MIVINNRKGFIFKFSRKKLSADNTIKLETAVRKQSGKLFNFIKRFVPSKEEAEDIMQDVLYKFALNFESVQLLDKTSSWLIHVAKNKIIDSNRKMKPSLLNDLAKYADEDEDENASSLEDLIPDISSMPDESYWRNQIWEEIQYALEDMPKNQREVFELTEFEGFTFKEIAEIKGTPISTLLSRKKFAVLFLRKRLKYLYEELIKNA